MRVVDVVRIDYVGLLLLTPWSMGDINNEARNDSILDSFVKRGCKEV